MFIAALSTIDQRWKQRKCPSPDKLNVVYYSAIKINGSLIHATTWKNLENIMLDEMSDTKGQILYTSTHMMSKQIHRDRR